MNTRITKSMASQAANAIVDDLYSNKIAAAKAAVGEAAAELVRKYIPAPVLAMTKEYPDYIESVNGVNLNCYNQNGYLLPSITATLPYKLPRAANYIVINLDDYAPLRKLYDVYIGLVNSRAKDYKRFCNALLELRTIKAVQRSMPEALKYLDVPVALNPPVRVYNDLRQILQTINTKDNETNSNAR